MVGYMVVTVLLVLLLAGLPGALAAGSLAAMGYNAGWIAGHATWYGDPHGEGSSGGACGYKELTGTPYGPRIAAGSRAIFQNGKGCGQCYAVKCTYPSCRWQPTRIVITDFCPGGTFCSSDQPALDLSGAAITSMALPGRDGELRNIGLYNILYKRVSCQYPRQNIAFKVDAGSSAYWLSITIKYQGGPGDVGSVYVRMAGSYSWQPMQHNWGANWMLISYSGKPFKGPYDIRVTARLNGHTVVARRAIPQYFQPGAQYNSNVQLRY